jgi:hypothetical protein
MKWTDLFGLLNAVCAGTLAGLAYGYAFWVHREGNGQRRWMQRLSRRVPARNQHCAANATLLLAAAGNPIPGPVPCYRRG